MKLVFATHNRNKYEEVKVLMPKGISLFSLDMINCHDEIPETGSTLEENAKIKADFVTKKYGINCFADDTGLLIDALHGEPGVYSARYAGPEKNVQANIDKVLLGLKAKTDRTARFETVIYLNLDGEEHSFRGIVNGEITTDVKGSNGFGYDPIFKPDGYKETFAELPLKTKNQISHRGLAIQQLIRFLEHKTWL